MFSVKREFNGPFTSGGRLLFNELFFYVVHFGLMFLTDSNH